MNSYTKTYFKNLDATRFIAFLAVLLEHAVTSTNQTIRNSSAFSFYANHFNIAEFGVQFFIVLSGFLITWIILEEYEKSSRFNISSFLFRRTLRIWPLYFLMIAIAFTLAWTFKEFTGATPHEMPSLLYLLTFTFNFYIISHGQSFLFFLVFLWSISVEEQCYLLWGIFLKWMKKLFVPFCILLILLSIGFRIYALQKGIPFYFNTLNWVGSFACGALLAIFCLKMGPLYERLTSIPKPVSLLVYVLFILNLIFRNHIYTSVATVAIENLVFNLFFVFILFEQAISVNPLVNLGKSSALSYLGKISYGLFCYHGLVILVLTQLFRQMGWADSNLTVFIINPLVIFALTVLISAISYRYFEKPIMALRYKLKTA